MSPKQEKNKTPASPENPATTPIPSTLPILALKDTIIFPEFPVPLTVGRKQSIQLVDDVILQNKLIGLVAQRDSGQAEPSGEQLFRIGTVGIIQKFLKHSDGTRRLIVKGIRRIRVLEFIQKTPYLIARTEPIPETSERNVEVEAMAKNLQHQVQKMVSLMPMIPEEVGLAFLNLSDPGRLADLVAANFLKSTEQRQEILETLELRERLVKVTRWISSEIEILELGSKIQRQVHEEMDEKQREFFLREQLKAIQRELGEKDPLSAQIDELEQKLAQAGMPGEVEKEARREIDRLRNIPPASPEHNVVRTYLDWLIALPWSRETPDRLDIVSARRVLDEDHEDLEKVKERILEYLAVRSLRKETRGPILCFVGPPGTGKTSLGRSIARAMGRKFHRISLGGIRDEAEIRGHRRTYVGALPGRILQGIRKCDSRNPVFMLDEIDKLGQDFRGDPSSALLEVLDPEQNFSFSDHYLDLPFDLSRVMFITTANVLESIPGPLRDRMEVLELPGYSEDQKIGIARNHLVPRQIHENGLRPDQISFTDEALHALIGHYTREAGLRNLERQIAAICRKVARGVAEGRKDPVHVGADRLADFLGPEKYFQEVVERTDRPGVAIGLAWTPFGGEILFIESTRMPGKGGLTLTGQLGEVMRESAQAALSIIRSQAGSLGIDDRTFTETDLHIHVPAGAIPKDGPSAGVPLLASLASLLLDRPCRPDLAATGEITLRGRILPVGGIKEKILAAHRAGIRTVLLPTRNEKDLADLPEEIREDLAFHFVDTVQAALEFILSPSPEKNQARISKTG